MCNRWMGEGTGMVMDVDVDVNIDIDIWVDSLRLIERYMVGPRTVEQLWGWTFNVRGF